jgi:shikimate kinase
MKKLVVLVGPPGSGKSTFAQECVGIGWIRINQDDQGKDHIRLFEEAVNLGKDIVVDRMGFSYHQRQRYIEFAKANGYHTEIVILYASHSICMERMSRRTNHPTIKDTETAKRVLAFFFSKYEPVEASEADLITKRGQSGYCHPAIICDLDGTLCNVKHRQHYVQREGKKDWNKFFLEMVNDTPNNNVLEILKRFSKDHDIVFCSGRPKEYEQLTIDWLYKHVTPHGFNTHLLMREAGDHRPDSIVKEIILDFDILTQWKPAFILDDRNQVVDMWRARGFECHQVAPGNF